MITSNIEEALNGANVLYTDVWTSMGEEESQESKDHKFNGFSINHESLNAASKDAIVMHCLPAYRGKEITDQVIESSQSRIFSQAENRLYAQQALLALLLSDHGGCL